MGIERQSMSELPPQIQTNHQTKCLNYALPTPFYSRTTNLPSFTKEKEEKEGKQ